MNYNVIHLSLQTKTHIVYSEIKFTITLSKMTFKPDIRDQTIFSFYVYVSVCIYIDDSTSRSIRTKEQTILSKYGTTDQ